jgi:hypothetical protein
MQKKRCNTCKETKPLDQMELHSYRKGKPYYSTRCLACKRKRYRKTKEETPEVLRGYWKRSSDKKKEARSAGTETEKLIYWDTRGSDRKHGRKNDLTKEYIAEQIAKGCSYCGEKELRMTLDRIDNNKGHLQTNCVPACIRCNYTRGDMPHEAWVVIARAMKRARKQGLFGKWTGRAR